MGVFVSLSTQTQKYILSRSAN